MNVDHINKKLQADEEWLRTFEKNVKKSAQLRDSIEDILENFEKRLQSLQDNVMPMHESNGLLQIKQQNIQKLLKTIDATIQFYGRTNELENSIREGMPSHDLDSYLESMECLQQAINFFQNNPERKMQLENMKMTLDTGFSVLEKEYRTIVVNNSLQPDAAVVIESLDEEAELLSGRYKSIPTLKNPETLCKLADWMLARSRGTRFLSQYAEIRGENMLRILNQVVIVFNHNRKQQRENKVKQIQKKVIRSEKNERESIRSTGNDEADCALTLVGCMIALITVEEYVMEKTIKDVSIRAQIHRELVSRPLQFVVRTLQRAVQECDNVLPLLPLLRFLSNHHNQLQTLSQNSTIDVPYETLMRQLRVKCSTFINEFVEKLKTDGNKFVPEDGNVHPITATTMNFLCQLTHHRQTVTHQILTMTAPPSQNISLLLPKLFARILSALGNTLQRKSENYENAILANLFQLNNYNYIAKGLQDETDALLPVISEQNHQILEFYLTQIDNFEQNYLTSWHPVVQTIAAVERIPSDDKTTLKNMITSFNREFETTCMQQRDYCISSPIRAGAVRNKIKRMIVPAYASLIDKLSANAGDSVMGKYVRYTEESLEVNIDRLFDASA